MESTRERHRDHGGPPIVGIGASAGGLQSLQRFFDHLPAGLDAAFVVVQHLSPDFESMMTTLLSRHTSMTVRKVQEATRVEAGHVYLLERNTELELQSGSLIPLPRNLEQVPSLPIDRFFESMAETAGERAVAVVLSGTGSDGTRGIARVKARGGWVIAESTASAQFGGMPSSAEQSGFVDSVLIPEEMGEEILERVSEGGGEKDLVASDLRHVKEIIGLVSDHTEIDFSAYRDKTISRRIERRMALVPVNKLRDYVELLRDSPEELVRLSEDMLIGVTRFFRDQQCFERLAEKVIPALFDEGGDRELRVWVAGCASGEEAYSVAMLLLEERDRRQVDRAIKVFATDVHRPALEFAAAGRYSEQRIVDVSRERLDRFFQEERGEYVVRDELRDLVVFSRHDLIANPPFTNLDLVTCRNLLIYLEPLAQRRVFGFFHFGIRDGGYLFLGPSESILQESHGFRAVDEKHRLFQRVPLPSARRADLSRHLHSRPVVPQAGQQTIGVTRSSENEGWMRTYEGLLRRYMPPSVLVDEESVVLDCYGGAEQYLHVRPRRPRGRIAEFLEPTTASAVSAALRRAEKKGGPVRLPGVDLVDDRGETLRAGVRVEQVDTTPGERRFLVMFEIDEAPAPSVGDDADLSDSERAHLRHVEAELETTRENLQATIEEIEVSNEELQAANEELVAANEEMQSTNEELNSVNEELHTVNTEYQKKNHELAELHRDMMQLLEAAEIGTLFLGPELELRRYSPDMASVFRVNEGDLGRPITDLAHTLDVEDLAGKLDRVRRSGERAEFEIRDADGRATLLRLTPSAHDGEVDGVLLTLVDIEELARAHRAVESQTERLQQLIDSIPLLVAQISSDEKYVVVNRAYCEEWGCPPDEILGKTLVEFLGEELYERIEPNVRRALRGESRRFELTRQSSDGTAVANLVHYEPVIDADGSCNGFYSATADVTTLRNVNRALLDARVQAEAADRAKSTFLANMSHEIRTPMSAILGHLELLQRTVREEQAGRSLDIVRRNGEHLLALINDVLHLSALDLGDRRPERAPTSPRAVVEDVLSLLENRVESREVSLGAEFVEGLPEYVETDPRRLRQILMNLVGNALKFTREGEVAVTVSYREQQLQTDVADSGPGIEPEQMEKLFQPFEQLDAASQRSGEGTGLGLSISSRLAEQLGGSLAVESEVGVGSTFSLRVPARALEPEEAEGAEAGIGQAGDHDIRLQGRILVVDDEADAREITYRFLAEAGARVDAVRSGRECLDAVGEATVSGDPYDLVFLDIHMPEMDGLEVVRTLRNSGETLPVVALTAGALHRDRVRALEAGCSDHAAKPIDRTSLLRLASSWLERPLSDEQIRRLLIVDDDDNTLEAMKELLGAEDFDIETATGVAAALDLCERAPFDVVLADLSLPDGSGADLVRKLRQRPEHDGTRYVAVSGWAASEQPDDAEAFDAWLQKPVSVSALLPLLR